MAQRNEKTVSADVAYQMQLLRSCTTTTIINKIQQSHDCQYENVTGVGIRIAVFDDGIDYTHVRMNGIGTCKSFQNAYGTSIYDIRNTLRGSIRDSIRDSTASHSNQGTNHTTDAYFPADTIIDSYDKLGDLYNNNNGNDNQNNDPNTASTSSTTVEVFTLDPTIIRLI